MLFQEKMYYAARSDHVAAMLLDGIFVQKLGENGEYGIPLFYQSADAVQRCSDCFGESEAHVFEVDMQGLTSDMLNDFAHIRASDHYMVFGEHTFLTSAVSPKRIKLVVGCPATPVQHSSHCQCPACNWNRNNP